MLHHKMLWCLILQIKTQIPGGWLSTNLAILLSNRLLKPRQLPLSQ